MFQFLAKDKHYIEIVKGIEESAKDITDDAVNKFEQRNFGGIDDIQW